MSPLLIRGRITYRVFDCELILRFLREIGQARARYFSLLHYIWGGTKRIRLEAGLPLSAPFDVRVFSAVNLVSEKAPSRQSANRGKSPIAFDTLRACYDNISGSEKAKLPRGRDAKLRASWGGGSRATELARGVKMTYPSVGNLLRTLEDLRQALQAMQTALLEFEDNLLRQLPPRPEAEQRPAEQSGSELLSISEVCQELGMGKSWVYRRIKSGEIPSIKLGHNIKVKRSDLEQYLKRQRHQATGR